MTAPTVRLSAECGMAADHGEHLHRWYRTGEDVPLPGAPYGPLLTKASCRCGCHGGTTAGPP